MVNVFKSSTIRVSRESWGWSDGMRLPGVRWRKAL